MAEEGTDTEFELFKKKTRVPKETTPKRLPRTISRLHSGNFRGRKSPNLSARARNSTRPKSKDGAQTFHFALTYVSKTGQNSQRKSHASGASAAHGKYIERQAAVEKQDPKDLAINDKSRAEYGQKYAENGNLDKVKNTPSSFGNTGKTPEERANFWNEFEKSERINGRVQHRLVVELPHELPAHARLEIMKNFADRELISKNLGFWGVVHAPDDHNDDRNFHGHFVFTDRPVRQYPDGTWDFMLVQTHKTARGFIDFRPERQKKLREMNGRDSRIWVASMRKSFCDISNEVMKKYGINKRYDHRTYKEMGISKVPTRHLGTRYAALEAQGIPTEISDFNTRAERQFQKEILITEALEGYCSASNQIENESHYLLEPQLQAPTDVHFDEFICAQQQFLHALELRAEALLDKQERLVRVKRRENFLANELKQPIVNRPYNRARRAEIEGEKAMLGVVKRVSMLRQELDQFRADAAEDLLACALARMTCIIGEPESTYSATKNHAGQAQLGTNHAINAGSLLNAPATSLSGPVLLSADVTKDISADQDPRLVRELSHDSSIDQASVEPNAQESESQKDADLEVIGTDDPREIVCKRSRYHRAIDQLPGIRDANAVNPPHLAGVLRVDRKVVAPSIPVAGNITSTNDRVRIPLAYGSRIRDIGDKIILTQSPDRFIGPDKRLVGLDKVASDAEAIVLIAKAKGWSSISIDGAPEFQEMVYYQAEKAGLTVVGYVRNDDAAKKVEGHMQALEAAETRAKAAEAELALLRNAPPPEPQVVYKEKLVIDPQTAIELQMANEKVNGLALGLEDERKKFILAEGQAKEQAERVKTIYRDKLETEAKLRQFEEALVAERRLKQRAELEAGQAAQIRADLERATLDNDRLLREKEEAEIKSQLKELTIQTKDRTIQSMGLELRQKDAALAVRDQTISKKDSELRMRKDVMAAMDANYIALGTRAVELQEQVRAYKKSLTAFGRMRDTLQRVLKVTPDVDRLEEQLRSFKKAYEDERAANQAVLRTQRFDELKMTYLDQGLRMPTKERLELIDMNNDIIFNRHDPKNKPLHYSATELNALMRDRGEMGFRLDMDRARISRDWTAARNKLNKKIVDSAGGCEIATAWIRDARKNLSAEVSGHAEMSLGEPIVKALDVELIRVQQAGQTKTAKRYKNR